MQGNHHLYVRIQVLEEYMISKRVLTLVEVEASAPIRNSLPLWQVLMWCLCPVFVGWASNVGINEVGSWTNNE